MLCLPPPPASFLGRKHLLNPLLQSHARLRVPLPRCVLALSVTVRGLLAARAALERRVVLPALRVAPHRQSPTKQESLINSQNLQGEIQRQVEPEVLRSCLREVQTKSLHLSLKTIDLCQRFISLRESPPRYRETEVFYGSLLQKGAVMAYRGTSPTRKRTLLGPWHMPRLLGGSQRGGRFLMGEVSLHVGRNQNLKDSKDVSCPASAT